jgi:hypothetical protein
MKHFFKAIILVLVNFLFLNSNAFSEKTENTIFKIDSITDDIDLNKFWKYHPDDDTLWAAFDFDDHDWDTTLQTRIDLSEISKEFFLGLG